MIKFPQSEAVSYPEDVPTSSHASYHDLANNEPTAIYNANPISIVPASATSENGNNNGEKIVPEANVNGDEQNFVIDPLSVNGLNGTVEEDKNTLNKITGQWGESDSENEGETEIENDSDDEYFDNGKSASPEHLAGIVRFRDMGKLRQKQVAKRTAYLFWGTLALCCCLYFLISRNVCKSAAKKPVTPASVIVSGGDAHAVQENLNENAEYYLYGDDSHDDVDRKRAKMIARGIVATYCCCALAWAFDWAYVLTSRYKTVYHDSCCTSCGRFCGYLTACSFINVFCPWMWCDGCVWRCCPRHYYSAHALARSELGERYVAAGFDRLVGEAFYNKEIPAGEVDKQHQPEIAALYFKKYHEAYCAQHNIPADNKEPKDVTVNDVKFFKSFMSRDARELSCACKAIKTLREEKARLANFLRRNEEFWRQKCVEALIERRLVGRFEARMPRGVLIVHVGRQVETAEAQETEQEQAASAAAEERRPADDATQA